MPIYIFKHPEKEEYQEVCLGMNDEKHFEKDGLTWERVFTSPQLNACPTSSLDPWDNAAFVNSTKNKKGTVGDLLDQSAELSAKRASENNGIDPVKQNYYKEYSKKRKGAIHPDQKKKSYSSKNVKVDYD